MNCEYCEEETVWHDAVVFSVYRSGSASLQMKKLYEVIHHKKCFELTCSDVNFRSVAITNRCSLCTDSLGNSRDCMQLDIGWAMPYRYETLLAHHHCYLNMVGMDWHERHTGWRAGMK